MAEYTSLSVEAGERSIHTKHVWLRVHRRFLGKRQLLLMMIVFGKGNWLVEDGIYILRLPIGAVGCTSEYTRHLNIVVLDAKERMAITQRPASPAEE